MQCAVAATKSSRPTDHCCAIRSGLVASSRSVVIQRPLRSIGRIRRRHGKIAGSSRECSTPAAGEGRRQERVQETGSSRRGREGGVRNEGRGQEEGGVVDKWRSVLLCQGS